jgi:hypothetical protein
LFTSTEEILPDEELQQNRLAGYVFAIKNRVITSLLTTLIVTFFAPISPAVANGDVLVSISAIEGVTPPVAGETPVQFITPNVEYTGEVFWSNIEGPLIGNFETLTSYVAEIIITPKPGYTLDGLVDNFFTVEGASRVSNYVSGEVIAIFNPIVGDATDYLDETFGTNGYFNIKDFFGEAPLNDSNTAVGPIKVDRIAVDSQDRIVVLASFYDADDVDNHILFRLNADGSYDNSFGVSGPSLRKVEGDTPKPYVLITTTGRCYGSSEKVDLEIVSADKILVLLSGTDVESECFGDYHNFVVQYDNNGTIDETFADEGVIGSLEPQSSTGYFPEAFFIDLTVDAEGQIVIASFSTFSPSELVIYRFDSSGFSDVEFCADYLTLSNPTDCDPGTAYVPIASPEILNLTSESDPELIWLNYRTLQIIADGTGGYVIAYTGPNLESLGGIFSQFIRLQENGQVDPTLRAPAGNGIDFGDQFIIPSFFVTDLVPDGLTGFIMSGTFLGSLSPEGFFGFVVRINWDGSFDTDFVGTNINPESNYLSPLVSEACFNTALLGNDITGQSNIGVIKGNFCTDGQAVGPSVKAFSPDGSFRGEFFIEQLTDESEFFDFKIVNQLEGTSTGKILALSGTRPTTGALGFLLAVGFLGVIAPDWTEATITRYQLPDLLIAPPDEPLGITGPEQVVGVVGTPIDPVSFTVTGGTGTETITVTTGYALPAGLTLSSAGLISGTPTAAGTTTTSFTVTDSSNETLTAYIQFVFTLTAQPLTITGPARITGTVGTAITPVNLTLGGGTGAETATVTAGFALPAGLTLSTAGRISGTPTAAGTTTTSFTVTDSLNETATATVEFVISLAPTTPPAPTPPVVVYVAPTPVPYLKTLTTPKLNLKDGKLMCTPGTYNAGYTLDGVVQGSATALFTPSSFRYNLLINGITQTSLAVTSSSTSQSWNMPTGSTGALVTCSVTVTANGLTNTDKSGDNSSGASSALTTQSAAIATANATYAAALAANTKAYQKAIVDNRTQWRSATEKIRTDYYAERDRIRSLPSTKATRALSSAALKAYTAALKKSAADYKASGPAALAAKDAADKAALTARESAIAKANAAYGTAIESIGYGVLIP